VTETLDVPLLHCPKEKSFLYNFFLSYFQWGDELAAPSPLFLEQSYDSVHLLQQVNSQKMLEGVSINHSTLLNTDNWKHANQQYFKCLAKMQQLRQVSLKFNKDLGLEEVSS
jgi:midasin